MYTEYTHIQYTYEATTMRQRTTLISIQRKLTSPTRVFMKYMYKFTLNLRNFAQVQIHEKCFKFTIYVSSTEIIANITLNMNYNDIIMSSKILEAICTRTLNINNITNITYSLLKNWKVEKRTRNISIEVQKKVQAFI